MKLVLTDPRKVSQFACILRHLKNISSDIMVYVDEDRLYTQGMDGAHAALFELNLTSGWFSTYEVEEEIHIGINCELIFKIFNCLEDNQNIEINYDVDEGDSLYITLYPREGERGIKKEFKLTLMNLDTELMPKINKDWSADIQMVSDEFSKLIDQLSIFGSDLIVHCSEDSIKLISDGEMGNMKAIIEEEDILLYAIEEDVDVKVKFAISYINMF